MLIRAFQFLFKIVAVQAVFCGFLSAQDAISQSHPVASQPAIFSETTYPRIIKFSGILRDAAGAPRSGTFQIQFSVFDKSDSETALWTESQNVTTSMDGQYAVLLGSQTSSGLPSALFANGEARWIGLTVNGEIQATRAMLVSVPYAMKAGDAETLGGLPLSAFQLNTSSANAKAQRLQESGKASPDPTTPVDNGGNPGVVNFLSKWTSSTNIGNSVAFDDGTNIGIGTTTPSQKLDVNGNIAFSSAPGNAGFAGFNVSGNGVFRAGINMPNLLGEGDDSKQGAFFTMDTRSDENAMAIWTKPANSATETERVTISSTGNVGIDNNAPAQALDVGGNVNVGGNLLVGSAALNAAMRGFNLSGDGVLRVGVNMPNLVGAGDTSKQGSFFSMDTRAGQSVLSIWTRPSGSSTESERVTVQSGGNVGIGNPSPAFLLDVGGAMRTAGGITFGDGTTQTTALSANSVVTGSNSTQIILANQNGAGAGSFSVGTAPPAGLSGNTTATSGFAAGVFGVTSSVDGYGVLGENLASGTSGNTSAGVRGITANTTTGGTGIWGDALEMSGDNIGVFGRTASSAGTGVEGQATATSGDAAGVYGTSASSNGTGVWGEVTSATVGSPIPAAVFGRASAGTAGLFTVTNSSASLLVGQNTAGSNVFRVDSTGHGFFNGTATTGGADFAESVDIAEQKSAYEPGDVIAIDTAGVRRFAKVSQPYSTLVAGIYSTKPGVLATKNQVEDPRIASDEIPLAVVGIVPCKVTNENGDINAGDLLVSSSTAGYAMKGTDRNKMAGAVVGKALQPMHNKNGVIEVLVSLQ